MRAEIDAPKRMLHARLHSAGHLLDSALANIGMNDLIPSKVWPIYCYICTWSSKIKLILYCYYYYYSLFPAQGYHFPDGPYVGKSTLIATLSFIKGTASATL